MNYELKKKLTKILIAIVSIFVLLFIILFIVKGCSNKKLSYEKLENKLVSASKKYLEEKELLPLNEAEIVSVYDSILIENGYMKEYSEYTDDTTCTGYVLVQKNNEQYNYMPYLSCEEYKTKTLKDEIVSKVVTNGDGVYKIGNEYVYRGEYVDNYFKFAGLKWRIIKLTDDGYLKLIAVKKDENSYIWDDRFNIATDDNSGINIFSKSRFKEALESIYEDSDIFSSTDRKSIVCRDICIGKRKIDDNSFSTNTECEELYSCMYVSTVDLKDAPMASIDENCDSLNNDSCENYNYTYDFIGGNWTTISVADTTDKVYKTSVTYTTPSKTNNIGSFHYVIYINSNMKFDGDGTSSSPYVLN